MTSVDLSRFQLAALPIIFFTLTMVIIIIYNGKQILHEKLSLRSKENLQSQQNPLSLA